MSVVAPRDRAGRVAAVAILLAFGLLLIWLLHGARSAEETVWSRLMVLYSGVEALAFAAAGALLGTQVQKARIEAAEDRADALGRDAKEGAARAADAEARGRSLRAAIESQEGATGGLESAEPTSLADIARRLFP